jgi:hypothetical protein
MNTAVAAGSPLGRRRMSGISQFKEHSSVVSTQSTFRD